MSATAHLKTKAYWPDLDVLRGLAAVLMLTNHLAVRILSPELINQGSLGLLTFLGSFAPVLYFFSTGLGYGVQTSPNKKHASWGVTFKKVSILFLADLLMNWSSGRWFGLDFLGFIGLSMLILEPIRRTSRPLLYCWTGIISITLLRYVVGPQVKNIVDTTTGLSKALAWLIGTSEISGVSYPLSPWIVYPLAGFIVGFTMMRYRDYVESHRLNTALQALTISLVPISIGVIVSSKKDIFFRWGTVAVGFYIVSFAAILLGVAWSLSICSSPSLKAWRANLSLTGLQSLAIVPIHYFLIELLAIFSIGQIWFYAVYLIFVIISFWMARHVEKLSYMLKEKPQRKIVLASLVLSLCIACSITFPSNAPSMFSAFGKTYGQLVLCILLIL